MRRLTLAPAVALVATLWAPVVLGEASGDREAARRAFERGTALFEQEQWEEALAAFDESLRLYPTQTALFNRSICLGLLGRPVEAVHPLEEHQRTYGSQVDEERRTAVEAELARLRPRVGFLDVRVEGTASAEVTVDGMSAGTAPFPRPITVNPGVHQVTVSAPGLSPVARTVTVNAGAVATVVVAIAEGQSAEESVTVVGDTGATPPTTPRAVPVEDRGRGLRIGAYVTTGVAVAALGVALGLFLWADGEYDTWTAEDAALHEALNAEEPPDPADYETRLSANNDLANRIERLDIVSWVLLGVGSAAAATAVTLYVLGLSRRLTSRTGNAPSVALLPSPTGVGIAASW
jgi:tetratricopeptide (TPR) repeat protein